MRRWTQKMSRKRGFTMVELLVVIIIIAVLVAIALPRYFAAIYAGRLNACKSNFKIINTAAQAYFAQNKVWPPAGIAGVADMITSSGTTPGGAAIKSGQLTEAPICPWSVPYALVTVGEDASKGVDGSNPQVGVETDWTDHFAAKEWQTATMHVEP